jgi:hypothetical protein
MLNGKLTLYAKRDATDQLRAVNNVSITITNRAKYEDIYVVTAKAKNAAGREDESTGAVNIANLKGDALANVFMKAETKAKRRVTLSICGLGLLDETEVDSIKDAKIFTEEDLNKSQNVIQNTTTVVNQAIDKVIQSSELHKNLEQSHIVNTQKITEEREVPRFPDKSKIIVSKEQIDLLFATATQCSVHFDDVKKLGHKYKVERWGTVTQDVYEAILSEIQNMRVSF